MSARPVIQPFEVFRDVDGTPLESGAIYIGTANLDPVANPIPVFWDEALTIAAAQPITTINGYPSRGGSPGQIFANSDYSILVRNKRGELVYSVASMADLGVSLTDALRTDLASTADPAKGDALVGVKSALTGGVARTQHDKNSEWVSVKDFGATGDGTTNDAPAINAAIAASDNVYFPPGTYKVTAAITLGADNKRIAGAPHGGSIIKGYGAISVLVIGNSSAGTGGNTFLGTYKNLVQDITISSGDSSVRHGIFLVGCRESDFINVDVIPATAGVGFTVAGIEMKECWTVNFIGGKVKWVSGKGLYINNTANGPSNNIKFLGTSFYGLNGIGIDDMGGSGRVYQTYVEDCAGGGIQTINIQGLDICGYFEGNTGFDIKLHTNTYDAFVHGCYFQGYDANHIMVSLSSAFGCTVTNCYMSFSGATLGAGCTGGSGVYCNAGSTGNTLGPLSLAQGGGATGNSLVGGSSTSVLTSDFSGSPFTFSQTFGRITTEANTNTGAKGEYRLTDVGVNAAIRDYSMALNQNVYGDAGIYRSASKGGDPLSGGVPVLYFGPGGGGIRTGTGVPSNADGNNGDFYFRMDTPGTINQRIYVKSGGSWAGIL